VDTTAIIPKTPDLSLQEFQAREAVVGATITHVLRRGIDYGTIPGVNQLMLLEPGAERLLRLHGYRAHISILEKHIDLAKPEIYFIVQCQIIDREGQLIGTYLGAASSTEPTFAYRQAERRCPKCGANAIIKGKAEYGGGWICWTKQGGCGAKYAADDPAIADQPQGRVPNPDLNGMLYTILSRAQKRAIVTAARMACGVSGYFKADPADYLIFGEAIEVTQPTERISGPLLANVLRHLGAEEQATRTLAGLGHSFEDLLNDRLPESILGSMMSLVREYGRDSLITAIVNLCQNSEQARQEVQLYCNRHGLPLGRGIRTTVTGLSYDHLFHLMLELTNLNLDEGEEA